MNRLKFSSYAEFGNFMYETASMDGQVVTAVMFFDNAVEVLRWLLAYDDITVGNLNIQHEDYGYSKEYYITLDTDLVLDVSPSYKFETDVTAEGYNIKDSDVFLYDGDVNSRIVILNSDSDSYEIIIEKGFSECDCCCGDCSNCEYRLSSETIDDKLDLIDYILNHIGD